MLSKAFVSLFCWLITTEFIHKQFGGFLLSAHSICVFFNTGFVVYIALYVLQDAYSIKECQVCYFLLDYRV